MKKYIIRFGIIFFIVLALLTYFSRTIDNVLLPQVKITEVVYGTIDGDVFPEDRFLVPISSVTSFGEEGTVFTADTLSDGNTYVTEMQVNICRSDDFYYEVTSKELHSTMHVVWSVSKPIESGDRVYVGEQ